MTNDLFQMVIEGADGSEWIVHGPGSESSPVRLEEGEIGEFFDAPVSVTSKARVGQPGSSYRGHRVLERSIPLRLTSYDPISAVEWARVDSDLRRAFRYDADAKITVTTELSGSRTLFVRLGEEPSFNGELDPHYQRAGRWVYPLVAYDPFWHSDTYSDEFVFDGLNWYSGGVFVDNPTDVDCWPSWVLTAPAKFILPDWNKDRQIVIPFQPYGRTAVVQTYPMEEMIVANDNTLLWAEMNGQFFMNPIPAYTSKTFVPVCVDPLPNIPWVLPDGWKVWIANRMEELARSLGLAGFFALTPTTLAGKIHEWMLEAGPDWLDPISDALLDNIVVDTLAQLIEAAWGQVGNLAGATAQVRLDRRWSRPWGLE